MWPLLLGAKKPFPSPSLSLSLLPFATLIFSRSTIYLHTPPYCRPFPLSPLLISLGFQILSRLLEGGVIRYLNSFIPATSSLRFRSSSPPNLIPIPRSDPVLLEELRIGGYRSVIAFFCSVPLNILRVRISSFRACLLSGRK